MNSNNKGKLSWMFYDFAASAYSITIITTIISMFLSASAQTANIPEYSAAFYFSCVTSVSTVVLVAIGAIFGTRADSFGKKKFLAAFIFIGAASTMLIAFVPIENYFIVILLYLISFVCYEASRIFYDALIVDSIHDKENITHSLIKMSSKGVYMGHLGGVIAFIVSIAVILLAQMEVISISIEKSFKIVFMISGFWWLAFSIPLIFRCNTFYTADKKESIFLIGRKIFSSKKISSFLLSYAMFFGGVIAFNTQFISTATDSGFGIVSLSLVIIIMNSTAILFTFLYSRLARAFGAKKIIFAGLCTYGLACIYLFVFQNTLGFYVISFIIGTAFGGIVALCRAYYADIIEPVHSTGFFAIYHIVGKFTAVTFFSITAIVNFISESYAASIIIIFVFLILGAVLLLFRGNE